MLKRLLPLVAFHVLFTSTASACSFAPSPWYDQVAGASFVGVVRCEVAGVVAARYRVVESWKGAPVGSLLTIDRQFRRFGAYSPFAVCGEKYLACVYSTSYLPLRPSNITDLAETISPYWWRDAEAEYHTDLPSLLRLPVGRGRALDQFGIWGKKVTVQAYRESVLTYLATPAAAQEDRVLRPWAKSLLRMAEYVPDPGTRQAMEQLGARVDSLGLDSLVNALLTLEIEHPKGRRGYAGSILAAGGERTLAALRSPRGLAAFPGDTLDPRHPVRQVADRQVPKRTPRLIRIPDPSDSALDAYRTAFTPPWGDRFMEAFSWLTVYDPETVIRWFEQDSVEPPPEWHRTTAYSLASYFAWRCNSRGQSILRRMLAARNPTVRVAGAVYLALEDSASGTGALEEFSGYEGFAGTWAATVLASQGHRQAVPRAFEAFNPPTSPYDRESIEATRGLQARLLVLLSNSAHANGVKMPDVDWARYSGSDKRYRKGTKELTNWWRKQGDRIQLVDPWRALYSGQKVD